MSFLSSVVSGLAKNAATRALSNFLGSGGSDSSISLSCSGSSMTLPVNPESFSCSVENKNGTVNINNLGEYNMMGKTGLKSITISSFFPAHDYNFMEAGCSSDAYSYVEKIESWRTSGKPLEITVANTPISFPCLIDAFKYGEQDGTRDVYYALSLKEYREQGTGLEKVLDSKTGLKKRPKLSYLQRAAATAAKRMIAGQNPMDAITGAMAAGGLTKKQSGYLDAFKVVAKHGGVKPGDVVKIGSRYIKINEKTVSSSGTSKAGSEGTLV